MFRDGIINLQMMQDVSFLNCLKEEKNSSDMQARIVAKIIKECEKKMQQLSQQQYFTTVTHFLTSEAQVKNEKNDKG